MLHAAHEGREPALVACTPPFMAEPSNNEFAVEKGPPRKCSRFSGADRFGRCRLHAEIYEPIVNYLGIAGGIVKRGSALETSNRGDHSMLQFPPVCTENLIRIDCVTESPNVNGDDRAALLLPDPVGLAVQVEEPSEPGAGHSGT